VTNDGRAVLEASVGRLHDLVESLSPEALRGQAYPSEWSVADVLGHLGSAAVIQVLRLDAASRGGEVDPQPVWDEWNAKDPDAKAADALAADRALMDRLQAMTADERAALAIPLGPLVMDDAMFIGLRVNEHALHSWDIAVTIDPTATLDPGTPEAVLSFVPMIAGFAGKPTGSVRDFRVRTTAPDRDFVVRLTADGVAVEDGEGADGTDLELPAEAFIRLIYGRLDPDHTPAFTGDGALLDELRRVFTGV
jgi:uncharacterized protein (TIGR03083 family)